MPTPTEVQEQISIFQNANPDEPLPLDLIEVAVSSVEPVMKQYWERVPLLTPGERTEGEDLSTQYIRYHLSNYSPKTDGSLEIWVLERVANLRVASVQTNVDKKNTSTSQTDELRHTLGRLIKNFTNFFSIY